MIRPRCMDWPARWPMARSSGFTERVPANKYGRVVGVGYKADVSQRSCSPCYSHPINFHCRTASNELNVAGDRFGVGRWPLSGIDKQRLGQVATEMHQLLRKPETPIRAGHSLC